MFTKAGEAIAAEKLISTNWGVSSASGPAFLGPSLDYLFRVALGITGSSTTRSRTGLHLMRGVLHNLVEANTHLFGFPALGDKRWRLCYVERYRMLWRSRHD